MWSNSDFGVIAYTIGDSTFSKTVPFPNKLNASFCDFEVVDVYDDW